MLLLGLECCACHSFVTHAFLLYPFVVAVILLYRFSTFLLFYISTFILHRYAETMTEEEEAVRLECVICRNEITSTDELAKVGYKGIRTLAHACEVKNYERLFVFFNSYRDASSKIPLHVSCRKRLIDLRNVTTTNGDEKESSPPLKKTRSVTNVFDWKAHCFICGLICDFKHSSRNPIRKVESCSLKDRILEVSDMENHSELRYRLMNCFDLEWPRKLYTTRDV